MTTLFEEKLPTRQHQEMIDITASIRTAIQKSGVSDGLAAIFVPHTTAGVTINENADPAVKRDILYKLNHLIPVSDNYQHSEGNSHAHLKASLFGFSEIVLIQKGQPLLGTWQNIYFCEFDGPRQRRYFIKITAG